MRVASDSGQIDSSALPTQPCGQLETRYPKPGDVLEQHALPAEEHHHVWQRFS